MATNNSNKQRRLHVASFATSDIAGGQVVGLALSVLFVVAGGVAAWVAAANSTANADAVAAARAVYSTAGRVQAGMQRFNAGGAQELAVALSQAGEAERAMARLSSSSSNPTVAPAVRTAATALGAGWVGMSQASGDFGAATAATAQLSVAVGKDSASFQRLLKHLEALGGAKSFPRAHEAAVRMAAYAESGFGLASLPRVEADLGVLNAELAASDAKQYVGFIEPLLAQSRSASAKRWTREGAVAFADASAAAGRAAGDLESAAMNSRAALYAGALAAILGVVGLLSALFVGRAILGDFGARYHRAMSQFRGGEQEKAQLLADIESLANNPGEAASFAVDGSELGDVAKLLQRISRDQVAVRRSIQSALESAANGERGAEGQLAGAVEHLDALARRLSSLSQAIDEVTERSASIATDAQAATHAAEEAGFRAADASRIAQEAGSRLEVMREGLQDSSKTVKRLGERTQELAALTEVLDGFAEQLSVLALNSGLEAERAGESGAGFRRIAKEARNLAERSAESVSKMAGLIQGAQADARSASETIDRTAGHAVVSGNVGAAYHAMLASVVPLTSSVVAMAKYIATLGSTVQSDAGKASDMVSSLNQSTSAVRERVAGAQDSLHTVSTAVAGVGAAVGVAQ